jgi:hypothetical protein
MLECNSHHTAPAIGFLRSPGQLRKFIRKSIYTAQLYADALLQICLVALIRSS